MTPDPRPPESATLLFDGVCNLCNEMVAWVIARDREGRFSIGSLQSRAAERTLSAASPPQALSGLPDGIVLVDAAGVHTRSDAALRLARGLGLPWSLLAGLFLVPRPLRDGAYALIARNRHRWFGTRGSCPVPAAALRSRFLDADERTERRGDSPEAPGPAAGGAVSTAPDAEPPGPSGNAPGPAWSFALRCVLAYVLLYLFPFPMGSFPKGVGIPGTGWLGAWQETLMHSFVPWVGRVVFGVAITQFPAGSGDTTYNWVEVFVYAALALLAAIGWTAIRRGQAVAPRTLDAVTAYVRFYLAAVMLVYGLDKALLLQFAVPGPDRLMMTYGESSPFGLLWTSMGASALYQFFSGVAETVGALLLLWRRTALPGALVTAGALLNVVMLNLSYDVPVKLFSSHLLLLALFVAAPHAGRLLGFLLFNLPTAPATLRPFPVRSVRRRRALLALKLLFVAWITIGQGASRYHRLQPIRGLQPGRPLHGAYGVESFALAGVADRALPDVERWVRVGIDGRGSAAIRFADGHVEQVGSTVDEGKKTLTFEREDPLPLVLTFDQPEPGVVLLRGRTGKGDMAVRLRRNDEAPPLTARGFHWINESPYYR